MAPENALVPGMMGIGVFFVAQVIYFFFVRFRYLSQLKRVMGVNRWKTTSES